MENLFEAFGLDTRLLVAQAVNFAILIVALWYLLYKPVLKVLSERQEKIAQGVLDAERASEKLAGADEEVKKRVMLADQEAEGMLASARETAQSERARLVKEAEQRAQAIEKDAQARAAEAQAKALRESEQEIARLAILAAAKALGEKK